MSRSGVALFPGSFDPFTNGHLDLVSRAARLFDQVVIAVAHNSAKSSMFTPEERVSLIRASVRGVRGVQVMRFEGLMVDCAKVVGARAIIRGLRAVSDFEFEFQMALMNRRLSPELEVAFLMPSQEYTYLNSTLVKEVARFGGRVRGLVPAPVEKALLARAKVLRLEGAAEKKKKTPRRR